MTEFVSVDQKEQITSNYLLCDDLALTHTHREFQDTLKEKGIFSANQVKIISRAFGHYNEFEARVFRANS